MHTLPAEFLIVDVQRMFVIYSFHDNVYPYSRDMFPSRLDGVGILEQLVELALLCLELGVAANVLLADEDVGHGALLGDVLESVLDRGTVVCECYVSDNVLIAESMVMTYRSGRAQGCRPLRPTR